MDIIDQLVANCKERKERNKIRLESKDSLRKLATRLAELRAAEKALSALGYSPYKQGSAQARAEFAIYIANQQQEVSEALRPIEETIVYLIQCGYTPQEAVNLGKFLIED